MARREQNKDRSGIYMGQYVLQILSPMVVGIVFPMRLAMPRCACTPSQPRALAPRARQRHDGVREGTSQHSINLSSYTSNGDSNPTTATTNTYLRRDQSRYKQPLPRKFHLAPISIPPNSNLPSEPPPESKHVQQHPPNPHQPHSNAQCAPSTRTHRPCTFVVSKESWRSNEFEA